MKKLIIICSLFFGIAVVNAQPCTVNLNLPTQVCQVDNSFDMNQYVSPTGGTWNITGGIFDPSLYAPGFVSVTYTYIDPAVPCTTVVSSNIFVEGNCCGNTGVNTVPLYGDVSSSYGAGWTNANVTIHGDFVIDNNFTINNSRIPIREDVTITVLPGAALTITNTSFLYSCLLNMWKGIEVLPGGTLNVNGSSWVEDAEVAVHVDHSIIGPAANISCNNARFNKNVYDILIEGGNIGPVYPLQVINGSSFTCRGQTPFSPGNTLDNNSSSSTKTKYHLYSKDNSTLVIGDNTTAWNEFSEGEIGIYVENTSMQVFHNIFHDFLQPAAIGSPKHAGIYAISTDKLETITIGEAGNGFNRFFDCSIGIEVEDYQKIHIERNVMRHVTLYPPLQTGIVNANLGINIRNNFIAGSDYSNTIIDNRIKSFNTAIRVTFVPSLTFNGTTLNISNNKISEGIANYTTGIRLESIIPSSNSGTANNWHLTANTIENCALGMYISGIRSTQMVVENNLISLDDVTPQTILTGMRLENNSKVTVFNNRVNGNGYTASFIQQRGMLVQNETGNNFVCNKLDDLGQSLVFDGLNPSIISGNKFKNAYDGFVLRNSGEVGPQGSLGVPSDNRWLGQYNRGQTSVLNTATANTSSPLYVRSFPAGFTPVINFGSPAGTEYSTSSGLINTFGPLVPCPLVSPGNLLALQVARSQHATDFFETSARWNGKQLLYAELMQDSSMLTEPVLDSFYQASTAECFAHTDYMLEALASGDTNLALYHQQQINPGCLPAQNFKDFYGIYLNWMQTGLFDSTNRSIVTTIANECPIVGGTVVFSARKFLEYFDQEFIWHEDEICDEPQNRNFSFEDLPSNYNLKVYPNPANELLNIEVDQPATYTIMDISGKIIESGQLLKNLHSINVSGFNNGFYILNIKLESELVSYKIAVNH